MEGRARGNPLTPHLRWVQVSDFIRWSGWSWGMVSAFGGVGGNLTCLIRAVVNRVACEDMDHDDRTLAETCQVLQEAGC
jgi:hypothetical protein